MRTTPAPSDVTAAGGHVVSAERIDPSKLSEQERSELSRALYRIHTRIFAGLDESTFEHYVVSSPAKETRLVLYRNTSDEIVGYYGVHRFEVSLAGETVVVFRAEAGLLPGYRQRDANLSFLLRRAAAYMLTHPRSRAYFLCAPVNPSSYGVITRRARSAYPRWDREVPAGTLRLMTRLADEVGLRRADGPNPLVRDVGWITRATDEEHAYWRSSSDPHIRFYLETNPGYTAGSGLLTVIPLTVAGTLRGLFGMTLHTAAKRLAARRHRVR